MNLQKLEVSTHPTKESSLNPSKPLKKKFTTKTGTQRDDTKKVIRIQLHDLSHLPRPVKKE